MRSFLTLAVVVAFAAAATAVPAPATRVERGDLKIEVEAAGRIQPATATEILIEPQAFAGRWVLLEAVEPGSLVAAGDIVLRFDDTDIAEAIEDARFELAAAKAALDALVERQRLAEEGSRDALDKRQIDFDAAEKAWRGYMEIAKPLDNEREELEMASARQWVQNARDELAQLDKLYDEDNLTDETEKIVLARARFDLAQRESNFKIRERQRAYADEYEEREREKSMALGVRTRKAELDRARREASLDAAARAIDLERGRRKFARQERDFARLCQDREAMTVRAPVAGILLHGGLEGGLERVHAPRSVMNLATAVACVADPAGLVAAVAAPQREALRLAPGQTAVISPDAAGAPEVNGVVRRVATLPRGGTFALEVTPAEPLLRALFGVAVKVRVLVEEHRSVTLVPKDCVRAAGDRTFCVVRRAPDKDEEVDVKTGATDGKKVVILSGLAEGDELVPAGGAQ